MVAYAVELFGEGSNEVKYLKRTVIPPPPHYAFSYFEHQIEELKKREATIARAQTD
jgi:hypothetical protein